MKVNLFKFCNAYVSFIIDLSVTSTFKKVVLSMILRDKDNRQAKKVVFYLGLQEAFLELSALLENRKLFRFKKADGVARCYTVSPIEGRSQDGFKHEIKTYAKVEPGMILELDEKKELGKTPKGFVKVDNVWFQQTDVLYYYLTAHQTVKVVEDVLFHIDTVKNHLVRAALEHDLEISY